MKSVFISYAREDSETALRIYEDLKLLGADPWIDQIDLLPGQDWAASITKQIKKSRYFLAIISAKSITKRGYYQKEVREAMKVLDEMPPGEVFFIPCRTEEVTLDHDALRKLQWLDLFPSYSEGIRRLKRALDLNEPQLAFSTSHEVRTALQEVERGLLKYKLSRARQIAESPLTFSLPTWSTQVTLRTHRSQKRITETMVRLQANLPIFNWRVIPRSSDTFLLIFAHHDQYEGFSFDLQKGLSNEGVSLLTAETKKTDIPAGRSLLFTTDDPTETIVRYPDGTIVMSTERGFFDTRTGEVLSEEAMEKLNEIVKKQGGFGVETVRG